MMWHRVDENGNQTSIIRDVTLGFKNVIFVEEKVRRKWFPLLKKKVIIKIISDVNVRDYVIDSPPIMTLLMKEIVTEEGDHKLIPLVSRDRRVLEDIQGVIDNVIEQKQEEIEMLKTALTVLQQRQKKEVNSYFEQFIRMYKFVEELIPLTLQSLHQRFEILQVYINEKYTEYDFKKIAGQQLRNLENELTDQYNQFLLDFKGAGIQSPALANFTQQAPRARTRTPRQRSLPPPQASPLPVEPAGVFDAIEQEIPQSSLPIMEDAPNSNGGVEKFNSKDHDIMDFVNAINEGKAKVVPEDE
jgi:hypothetical protein